ncbi:SET domain-containing protein-lysine N-methyltransferase [Candidatus Peribacteria bacterium]|nr:SET domain-containing protein-lysine N-methyltransferase [Candidatus Peribacteria bacterium]
MHLSWLNPKVKVDKSNINGAGLFAYKKIKRNEVILVQAGKVCSVSEIYHKNPQISDICFLIDKNFFICPIKVKGKFYKDGAFLMNHSCDPNCGLRGQIIFIAIRDICANEELTYDYAMTDSCTDDREIFTKPMQCSCGSKKCRKDISDNDWKNPVLKKGYHGYFSSYIKSMISEKFRDK